LSERSSRSERSELRRTALGEQRSEVGARAPTAPESRLPMPAFRASADVNCPHERRQPMTTVYDFSAHTLTGKPRRMSDFKGNVLLVVNTASKCGFTPQYAGLEALYRKYKDKGLVVLGFPSNQFGEQEPGPESEIAEFCEVNYGVTFPMFAKVDVNGTGAHPLFKYLTSSKKGLLGSQAIKWNFTKFLVGRDGTVQERYAPTTKPEDIEADIEKALAA
jgi:glutathione peroxidase